MNNTAITTLLAHRADCGKPSKNGDRVSPLAAHSRRVWRRCSFRVVIALFAFGVALTGAPLTGFVAPASAETTFVYEQLKSFGTPSIGGFSSAELIQGADGALYGTANSGGTGYGTVFKLNQDGSALTVLHYFDHTFAGHQREFGTVVGCTYSRLIQGRDGVLYGTSTLGGSRSQGTVFKLNTDGTGFGVLLDFDLNITGGNPQGGVVQGSDDALYGTAKEGGANFTGTVFRLNTDGSGFTILKNLDDPLNSTSGSYPRAGLVLGPDGVLYGTTTQGGGGGNWVGHYGTIFKLNEDGSNFTALKNFGLSDPSAGSVGEGPRLMLGVDGAIYGMAWGSSSRGGTVFKLNTDGSNFTVLKNLDFTTTGAYPYAGLVQGADNALYGTTSKGTAVAYEGGTLFKLNTDGTGFTVLKHLDYGTGHSPHAALVRSADGALYGTTSLGGSGGGGTVFKLNPDGSGFSVLANLSSVADLTEGGGHPAGLVQGIDGALYGTAEGGSSGFGTLFKLNPDGNDFTVLQTFDGSTMGAGPMGLTQGTDGSLYGTAAGGGTSFQGTFFKLNRNGSGFTVLRNFDSSTSNPNPGLIQGADGAFYGTTQSDGAYGAGTVFKLSRDGSDFTVLQSFGESTIGFYPTGGLSQGPDGTLYGTTIYGGTPDFPTSAGTVFKLDPDGSGFTLLKDFDLDTFATGGYPQTGLIQGIDGALYGTTPIGGSDAGGTVFKLNPDGSEFTVLQNLSVAIDAFDNNIAWLVPGPDDTLYGATTFGGSGGSGTSFKLNQNGTGFTVLWNFGPFATGAHPNAGLIRGADGNLYGTTKDGGDANGGTVFRLVEVNRPAISTLTPPSVASGSGAFSLTVQGNSFAEGAVVRWNGADLDTTFVSSSQLAAAVPTTPVTDDISTALITVRNPDGTTSSPEVFLVLAANVAEVESNVAGPTQTVIVSTAPTAPDPSDPQDTGNTAGITAILRNSGTPSPVTVSTAIYSGNPAPESSFFAADSPVGVAGEFMDLQVVGADQADLMTAHFYYPTAAVESGTSPTLKYFNGSDWADVLDGGGATPAKDTTNNLEGTISGGRFTVTFNNTSTPKLTELDGAFFAIAVPKLTLSFTGFLAPIGGADATGGSFATPLRTFKAGSTIPVKFSISRNGTAVVSGVHRLQAVKYSNETTAASPIDATPQDTATTGNQFVLKGSDWHFNLDTKATGLTKGIWQLAATLSDGSQHRVWIQIK